MKQIFLIVVVCVVVSLVYAICQKTEKRSDKLVEEVMATEDMTEDITEIKSKNLIKVNPVMLQPVNSNMTQVIEDTLYENRFIEEMLLQSDVIYYSEAFETKIVYIYLIYDNYYTEKIVNANYINGEVIDIEIEAGLKNIYLLFPEYTTVEAFADTDSTLVREYQTIYIDGDGSTDSAGGNLFYRVYKNSEGFTEDEEILFEIKGASSKKEVTSDTDCYGIYLFNIRLSDKQ